jgi:putative acetyltransferase
VVSIIDTNAGPPDRTLEVHIQTFARRLSAVETNLAPNDISERDNLSGLRAPNVTVCSVWDGAALAGTGALKELEGATGELKSMRTHPQHLRKGVAAALLEHIIGESRGRGLRRLSLETGSGPAFARALALYRKHGFVDGGAFGDYEQSDFNQFLHLAL